MKNAQKVTLLSPFRLHYSWTYPTSRAGAVFRDQAQAQAQARAQAQAQARAQAQAQAQPNFGVKFLRDVLAQWCNQGIKSLLMLPRVI